MELADAAAGYHKIIERQMAAAMADNGGREPDPWLVMLPQIGKPQEIHLTADDLVAFVRSRRFDYLTKILQLFSQYNSMIYGVEGAAIGVRH